MNIRAVTLTLSATVLAASVVSTPRTLSRRNRYVGCYQESWFCFRIKKLPKPA